MASQDQSQSTDAVMDECSNRKQSSHDVTNYKEHPLYQKRMRMKKSEEILMGQKEMEYLLRENKVSTYTLFD